MFKACKFLGSFEFSFIDSQKTMAPYVKSEDFALFPFLPFRRGFSTATNVKFFYSFDTSLLANVLIGINRGLMFWKPLSKIAS